MEIPLKEGGEGSFLQKFVKFVKICACVFNTTVYNCCQREQRPDEGAVLIFRNLYSKPASPEAFGRRDRLGAFSMSPTRTRTRNFL